MPGKHNELGRITRNISLANTRNELYEKITKGIHTISKASAVILLIYDEQEKKLSVQHSHGLPADYLSNIEKDVAVGYSALKSKKIKIIHDIKQLHRKKDKTATGSQKKGTISSLAAIPLWTTTAKIGCLNVYFARSTRTLKDKATIDVFSRTAALAIAHHQANERVKSVDRMINGLEETSKLLTCCLTTGEVAKKILAIATSMSNTDSGSLLLIDEKNRKVIKAYEYRRRTSKIQEYESTARLEQGISGEILKKRTAIAVSDLVNYENVNPVAIRKKRVSVAGIPLITREKIIGILFLDSFTPRIFDQAEIEYLNLLSNHAAANLENALLNDILQREAKETALLYEVSQSLISTLDFDQLLKNILEHLKETFDFLNISVLLVDEEQQTLYTHSSISYSPEDSNLRLKIGKDGITGHVAKTKAMYYSADVRKDNYYVSGNNKTRSEVCFPLLIGERLIGVLDVESGKLDGFALDAIRLLSSLSAQIAIAIDNARLYAETKKLSLTDPLTSLSNRRSFDIFIDAEIRRAERYRRTFVVMMIDFDNFKNYNDKYGHTAGDVVLQKLSKIMKDIIRDVDFLCRYGGDEFVSILPETDASFALDVAERMRKKIAAQKIQPKVTLSIGIASFPHDARDKSRLIDLADQACYEAKQRGGNRVLFTFKPKEDR